MTDEVEFAELCDLLHQAICERREKADLNPCREMSTGDTEREFAHAILVVLGLEPYIPCVDCGGETELYMVKDAVWAEAGLEPDAGWVCLADLSRRLGRTLGEADFPAPIWMCAARPEEGTS